MVTRHGSDRWYQDNGCNPLAEGSIPSRASLSKGVYLESMRELEDMLIDLYQIGLVKIEIDDHGETRYSIADGVDINDALRRLE